MGCVIQAGLGQNVARQASIKAGSHRGSGSYAERSVRFRFNSVNAAAQMILAGDADIVIAGGSREYVRGSVRF